MPVGTLDDVEHVIDVIREQGEGTSSSPADAPGDDHVAHYYAFAEIYHGRELREEGGGWQYTGAAVPFPDTRPMARVPAGGWDAPPTRPGGSSTPSTTRTPACWSRSTPRGPTRTRTA